MFTKDIIDWLNNLDENFYDIILDSMDNSTREETALAIQNQQKLSPKQNTGVICSIVFHMFKFIGNVKPDASLCRSLATLLKEKLQDTYRQELLSEEERIKVKMVKGDGGKTELAQRISWSFYSKYLRKK